MNGLEHAVAMGGLIVGTAAITAAIYTCFKGNRRRSWQFLSVGLTLILTLPPIAVDMQLDREARPVFNGPGSDVSREYLNAWWIGLDLKEPNPKYSRPPLGLTDVHCLSASWMSGGAYYLRFRFSDIDIDPCIRAMKISSTRLDSPEKTDWWHEEVLPASHKTYSVTRLGGGWVSSLTVDFESSVAFVIVNWIDL